MHYSNTSYQIINLVMRERERERKSRSKSERRSSHKEKRKNDSPLKKSSHKKEMNDAVAGERDSLNVYLNYKCLNVL